MKWETLKPDERDSWLSVEHAAAFNSFVRLCNRDYKGLASSNSSSIFRGFSNGLKSNRDQVVYDFDLDILMSRVKTFIEDYNAEVDRYSRSGIGENIDEFVRYDKIKWSETLKANVERGRSAKFSSMAIRSSLFRPFCKSWVYFDPMLVERRYHLPDYFPV